MKLKYGISLFLIMLLFGCGGGGGGSTGPSLTISNLTINPNTIPAGSSFNTYLISFNYSSSNGLLSVTYIYEGVTEVVDITNLGCTAQKTVCSGFIFTGQVSNTVGTITIPVYVTNTAGNTSNTVNITIIQT